MKKIILIILLTISLCVKADIPDPFLYERMMILETEIHVMKEDIEIMKRNILSLIIYLEDMESSYQRYSCKDND